MKDASGVTYTPDYITLMAWDNKDDFMIDDARTFINETYDLSKSLFTQLDRMVRKTSDFDTYYDYIVTSPESVLRDVCSVASFSFFFFARFRFRIFSFFLLLFMFFVVVVPMLLS